MCSSTCLLITGGQADKTSFNHHRFDNRFRQPAQTMKTPRSGSSRRSMEEVPPVLLGRLWPGEKVIMGTFVSHWLREALLEYAEVVQFRCKQIDMIEADIDQGRVFNDLKRFQHAKHFLSLQFVTTNRILADMVHGTSGTSSGSVASELWMGFMLGIRELSHRDLLSLDLKNWAVATTVDKTEKMTKALASCHSLTYLNLGANALGARATSSLEGLAKVLGNCAQTLQHLDLSENQLGSEGARALASALGQCSSLEVLNLNSNQICADGVGCLSSLGHNTVLQGLFLASNNLCEAGTGMLRGVLQSSLTHLDLAGNAMGPEGAGKLSWVREQCAGLKILNLAHNQVGWKGAGMLAWTVGECHALERLNVRLNDMGARGASGLCGGLRRCSSLLHLDLWGNSIGNEGVACVARLLPGLPRLSHLNLGDNKIFFSGAEMLAQVLDTCPSLVYLNLQCNMIDDVGVGHLAAALQKGEIRFLNLGWNIIGRGGALQLARAVAQCSKLEALILEGNAIDEEGASEILAEAEASLRAACAEAGASARGRVLSLNAEVRVHSESD